MINDVPISARSVRDIVAKPVTFKKTNTATGIVKADPNDPTRFYIPQGTVYPSNDDKAVGIVMWSTYVDQEDATLVIILRGHLREEVVKKVQDVSATAKPVLNGITFETVDANFK